MVYSTLIRNLINWEKFVNVPWLPVIMSLPSNNLMCPFYWKICLTNNSENVIYCTLSAYENGVCHTKQGNNQDQIIKNVTAIKTKFSIQNDPLNNQFLPQILWSVRPTRFIMVSMVFDIRGAGFLMESKYFKLFKTTVQPQQQWKNWKK